MTVKGTGARCFCGRVLSDPWLRSTTPLIYDGSMLPGDVASTASHGSTASHAGEVSDTQLTITPSNVDTKKETMAQNKGKWWYRFTWI